MSIQIYAGNLPYSMTYNELKDLFIGHGEVVSAKIIIDRISGRSKGFGFVEMEKENEAQSAIQSLNESSVGGRNIRVNVARPKKERSVEENLV